MQIRVQDVAITSSGLGLTDVNYKRNIDIVQQDRDGTTLRRWSLSRAWPVKLTTLRSVALTDTSRCSVQFESWPVTGTTSPTRTSSNRSRSPRPSDAGLEARPTARFNAGAAQVVHEPLTQSPHLRPLSLVVSLIIHVPGVV